MNKLKWFLLALLMCPLLPACTNEPPKDSPIIARINDYELSQDAFEKMLTAESELDPNFKLTHDAQKAFLDQLIRKEILIQEAKRLELDKREDFARAIERYWETTLIRSLMELKSREIVAKTFIDEEEIKAQYNQMKHSGETNLPFSKVREQIRQSLLEKKKTKRLKQWINKLQEQASIEINNKLLPPNPS